MIVKSYSALGSSPVIQRASVVVIEDDKGNPISFVSQHGDYFVFSDLSREDFTRLLQSVGIDKTVLVDKLGGDKELILPK